MSKSANILYLVMALGSVLASVMIAMLGLTPVVPIHERVGLAIAQVAVVMVLLVDWYVWRDLHGEISWHYEMFDLFGLLGLGGALAVVWRRRLAGDADSHLPGMEWFGFLVGAYAIACVLMWTGLAKDPAGRFLVANYLGQDGDPAASARRARNLLGLFAVLIIAVSAAMLFVSPERVSADDVTDEILGWLRAGAPAVVVLGYAVGYAIWVPAKRRFVRRVWSVIRGSGSGLRDAERAECEQPAPVLRCFLSFHFRDDHAEKYARQVSRFLGLLDVEAVDGAEYRAGYVADKVQTKMRECHMTIQILTCDRTKDQERNSSALDAEGGFAEGAGHVVHRLVERGALTNALFFGGKEHIEFDPDAVCQTFLVLGEQIRQVKKGLAVKRVEVGSS